MIGTLTLQSISSQLHTIGIVQSILWIITLLIGVLLCAWVLRDQSDRISGNWITPVDLCPLDQARMFHEVIEQASIVMMTDRDGTIRYVNDAFCEISGYTRHELLGSNCRIINSGYHTKEFFTSMFRTISKGQVWRGEICNRKKDGSIYWVDTTIVPIKDEQGSVTSFYSNRIDITHQKEIENELKLVLDAMPSIVICKDESNNILRINQAGAEVIGLEPSQIQQHNAREFFSEHNPLASYEEDLDVLAQGVPQTGIIKTLQDEHGNHTTLTIDKIPILDSSGFFSKLVTIATDITNISEIEQRLSFALESTNAGIWDWDTNAKTLHTNDLYFTMLGDEPLPSPIPSGHYFDRMHQEDLERVKKHIDSFVQSGESRFQDEFRILHADGSYRWIRSDALVIERNRDGSAKRIIGQHHDIDASKRLDLAIRTALEVNASGTQQETLDELCRALAESTNACFAGVAVPTKKSEHATARLLAGSSYGKPVIPFEYELKGTPCESTLSNEFCLVEQDVASMYPDDLLLESMNAQGYAGLRLTSGSGELIGLIMVVHDKPLRSPIDPKTALKLFGARASVELEHRMYADHLKEALQLAESSNRAKSDFIANMSHEIRTPMTAILGYTEILEEQQSSSKTDASTSAIQTIRKNGEHLLTVINDILDISKIEAGKMHAEFVDVCPLELVISIEQLLAERARGKGLEFHIEFPSRIPSRVRTDPTRLRQILLNLVGNAIKFTRGGSITLRCSYADHENQLIFEVLDTGIGMTLEQCGIIFDAFTQADSSTTREFGGSGLGLRISSTLAKMLGGRIQVESELGFGSRFWFTVDPGKIDNTEMVGIQEYHDLKESMMSTITNEQSAQPLMLEGFKVLLVEDGPDNQTLILHHLQRAGAIVDIAENGKVCLDMLTESSEYDLVLMDMQMPVLDGYETTKQIRARGQTLPIIALTAHAMSSDREKCIAVGCDEYHAKPIKKAQLIELCRELINQRQQGSDQEPLAA